MQTELLHVKRARAQAKWKMQLLFHKNFESKMKYCIIYTSRTLQALIQFTICKWLRFRTTFSYYVLVLRFRTTFSYYVFVLEGDNVCSSDNVCSTDESVMTFVQMTSLRTWKMQQFQAIWIGYLTCCKLPCGHDRLVTVSFLLFPGIPGSNLRQGY